MKRNKIIILVVLLIFVAAGSYLVLTTLNEKLLLPVNFPEQSAKATEVETDMRLSEYEALLKPAVDSGILFKTWSRLEEIEPENILSYFIHSANDKSKYSSGAGNEFAIPGDEMESFMFSKFYGNNTFFRDSEFYDEARDVYILKGLVSEDHSYAVKNVISTLDTTVIIDQLNDSKPLNRSTVQLENNEDKRFASCIAMSDPENERIISGIETADANTQAFLNYVSDDILSRIFHLSNNMLFDPASGVSGFDNAARLSSNQLIKFYMALFVQNSDKMTKAFNGSDGNYHVLAADISAVLNDYFESAVFKPDGLDLPGVIYSAESGEIIISDSALYSEQPPFWYQIEKIELLSADTIAITAERHEMESYVSAQSSLSVSRETLILKITSDGYRIVSLVIVE